MTFAITQNCCSDATCVSVCPVNAIHPTPEERAFGSTEMLHVDPRSCIDCGACGDACPIDAIVPATSLFGPEKVYVEINRAYYDDQPEPARTGPNFHPWPQPSFERLVPSAFKGLDVAVVGTGPAGMYAVEDLVLHTGSQVTLIDRLRTPGGLVNYGVAPDHPSTKKVGETFERLRTHDRVKLMLGTEIGRDLTHADLLAKHDAVVYAVGAPDDRKLGAPGEEHAHAATRFVAWCNGHPDVPADAFDLSTGRVVIVGMGNVALDVARILLCDENTLEGTSIAPHALAALRRSRVREVVMLARGESASYTRNERLGFDSAVSTGAVFRHNVQVESVSPSGVLTTDGDFIEAGLVLRAIGSRGVRVPGLPFDEASGTVPNDRGRVAGVPGAYVVGWAKRGPSGGIGANRACAKETIGELLEDAWAGRLPERDRPLKRVLALVGR